LETYTGWFEAEEGLGFIGVGWRRRTEEKRWEPGSREKEQDNKAPNIQDTDEQQRCIVSIFPSINELFVTLEVRAKTYQITSDYLALLPALRFFWLPWLL